MKFNNAQKSHGLKVAILSKESATLKGLSDCLANADDAIRVQIWPADATHLGAMVEQEQPDLLMFETSGGSENELGLLESVMTRHREMSVIVLSAQHHPDFLLSAMRMGVCEVIKTPFNPAELQQAVNRVKERISWNGIQKEPGKVLAFMPCKGGSGSTFLGANLAYALSAAKKRVCLIDLNLHFGDAALHVSEQAASLTVVDVISQIQRLDGALLESSMLRINPWFDLLAAPDSPAHAGDVRPESIERMISVARNSYDFVLVDVSRTLDANVVKVLDCADQIYLVMQLTLPFIRDAGRLLKIFGTLGYPKEKSQLLLNRFDKKSEITLEDIEKTLNQKVWRTIPNSFNIVAESINHGRPIVDLAPRDPVARALREMAAELSTVVPDSSAWWQRLFGLAAA